MKRTTLLLIFLFPEFILAQTNGVFGGDAAASGFPHQANTQNMWIKLATMNLNGNYKPGTLLVDFYPDEAPHGDSRQTLMVVLRNGNNAFYDQNSDIVLITHYGHHKTISNVKVVKTSGTGSVNNLFSIWVQMGASWLANVPIEVRTYGAVSCFTTNQPYFTDIQETGIVYDLTSNYGMFKDNFGIGTSIPSEKLEVNGTIRSKEVKVEASPWPDYVFEPDYNLKSLEEIEKFIKSNNHLPEIPSAKEMEANGVQLGEMNMLLLKKIEELTLYTLEQERRIQELEIKDEKLNSPRPSDTPLFSKRGEEVEDLRGELEKKITELKFLTITQSKLIQNLKSQNDQLSQQLMVNSQAQQELLKRLNTLEEKINEDEQ